MVVFLKSQFWEEINKTWLESSYCLKTFRSLCERWGKPLLPQSCWAGPWLSSLEHEDVVFTLPPSVWVLLSPPLPHPVLYVPQYSSLSLSRGKAAFGREASSSPVSSPEAVEEATTVWEEVSHAVLSCFRSKKERQMIQRWLEPKHRLCWGGRDTCGKYGKVASFV